jgi:hypothetical protein
MLLPIAKSYEILEKAVLSTREDYIFMGNPDKIHQNLAQTWHKTKTTYTFVSVSD